MPWPLPGLTLAWVARAVVSSAWWRLLHPDCGWKFHFLWALWAHIFLLESATSLPIAGNKSPFRPDQIFCCSKSGRNHKNCSMKSIFQSWIRQWAQWIPHIFLKSSHIFRQFFHSHRQSAQISRWSRATLRVWRRKPLPGRRRPRRSRSFGESPKWVSSLGWTWIRFYGIKMDLICFYWDWTWFNMI